MPGDSKRAAHRTALCRVPGERRLEAPPTTTAVLRAGLGEGRGQQGLAGAWVLGP